MQRDVADRVLARIAEGSSLRKACEADGISHCSVLDWIRADKELANQYARVKEISCQMWADQILEIADDSGGDVVQTEHGPKQDAEFTARSRLRVDSRKWLLSKLLPKVYGDKLDVTATVGVTVQASPIDEQL